MHMNVRMTLAALAVLAIAGLSACGGAETPESTSAPGEAATGAATDAEAQAAAEQKKTAAVQAAEQRLAQVQVQVSNLQSRAQAVGIDPDSDLAGLIQELGGQATEADRTLGQLKTASTESWEAASSRVDGAIRTTEGSFAAIEAQLAEIERAQEERRQQLLAMKAAVGELAEDLVAGLDGDIYLAYSRSTVERVKTALTELGLYRGTIDGELDDDTMLALARFQEMNLLSVHGVPSPATRERLSIE